MAQKLQLWLINGGLLQDQSFTTWKLHLGWNTKVIPAINQKVLWYRKDDGWTLKLDSDRSQRQRDMFDSLEW